MRITKKLRARLSRYRFRTATAEGGVGVDGAYVGEVAPAAFAFGVGADFDGGGEGFASGEVEVAEDEEFSEGGEV